MEKLLLEVANLQEEITKLQLKRQEDIWHSAVSLPLYPSRLSKFFFGNLQLAGQVPPTVPSRGAVPKQNSQQLLRTTSKTEVNSPASLPLGKPAASGVDSMLSLPNNAAQSFDVIKENQELRYRYFILKLVFCLV
jgi:hypothetical protein